MLTLRIVYPEEFTALRRLFFLTENRNLENSDFWIENGYLYLTSKISNELSDLLHRFEIETIWAPLWVEGVTRGLFSDEAAVAAKLMGLDSIPEIPWVASYGPVIFINREFYPTAIRINYTPVNLTYIGDIDPKRLITGNLVGQPRTEGYYQLPPKVTVKEIDCYLQGWNFFILPFDISIGELRSLIFRNYKRTRSRRVPGGRTIVPFADLGYAVSLDSADELISLHSTNVPIDSSRKLYFPSNPDLQGSDAEIWRYPAKVGNEDLHLELSYSRDTGGLDPEYYKYRFDQIKNMDQNTKDFFIAKYLS